MKLGVAVGKASTTVAAADERGDPSVDAVPGTLTRSLAVRGQPLLELRERIDAVAAAVPDSWLHQAATGALRRERLRQVICDELGLPLGAVVGRAAAAAATLAGHERRGACLICDIDTTAVCIARYAFAGHDTRLVDIEIADTVPDPADPRCMQLGRIAAVAARQRHGRAELVLPRARRLPRYRDTPVYASEAEEFGTPVTAGQVLDCHEPVAEAVRAAMRSLLARPGGGVAANVPLVLAGELGAFPLTQDVVLESLAAADGGIRPAGFTVLDDSAVARGAVLIAGGAAGAPEPARYPLRMPVHRVVDGELARGWVDLVSAGAPPSVVVAAGGEPLVVEVAPPGGRPLEVELFDGSSGTHRALGATGATGTTGGAGTVVPPGRYTVAYWPNRRDPGTVVLRPASGDPLVYSLVEPDRPARLLQGHAS